MVIAGPTPIPEGYYSNISGTLIYTIEDWNEEDSLWWWSPTWIDRGHVYATIGGQMRFDLSDWGVNDASNVICEEPIPYFDVNITKKNGELNFTNPSLSNSEIAIALGLGYMNFQPGLLVRIDDWNALKSVALDQSAVEQSWNPGTFDYAEVSVDIGSKRVVFDFKQTTGMRQNTTLTYEKETGILIEAVTQMSGYWCHIIIKNSIPGYEMFGLVSISIVSVILVTVLIRKRVIPRKN